MASNEDISSLPMAEQLEKVLRGNLSEVQHLKITDVSANCGNSFEIEIVSPDFKGKTTLARHKMINNLLADQIKKLHAFTQKSYTPEQWEKLKAQ